MLIYYGLTILFNIIITVIFYENINITGLSVVPLFLIILMIFQSFIFKTEKVESEFQIQYGSKLTADEENRMFSSTSAFMLAAVPWMVPFIFFFPSSLKLISIAVYIFGLIGGFVLYRIKSNKKIKERIETEEKERKAQEKMEQLGKWK